jgi:hypothetical protein
VRERKKEGERERERERERNKEIEREETKYQDEINETIQPKSVQNTSLPNLEKVMQIRQ